MTAPPAHPKRRTLVEFGRQLTIGDLWIRDRDQTTFQLQQIWRTDRLVHLAPVDPNQGPITIRFTALRDKWHRAT